MDKKVKKHVIAAVIAMTTMGFVSGGALAGGFLDVAFDDAIFTDPDGPGGTLPGTIIDNPYWPLRPDDSSIPRVFTYIGETEDECVIDQISVDDIIYGATYYLTGLGLTAVQVVDTEWVFEELPEGVECDTDLLPDDDAIAELTLDWYMQDDQENVWYVGEASRDFGEVEIDETEHECPSLDDLGLGSPIGAWDFPELFYECTGGSWEAGNAHGLDEEDVPAEAGIVVPGDKPILGEPLTPGTYYFQEVAYEAEDMAKILRLNTSVSVEADDVDIAVDYENCRTVKEWNPYEHGESVEHKIYCAGPGLVLIEGIGGGPTEVEELVSIVPPL